MNFSEKKKKHNTKCYKHYNVEQLVLRLESCLLPLRVQVLSVSPKLMRYYLKNILSAYWDVFSYGIY